MIRSAVLCHAPEDRAFAENLARFLAMNCPIEVSVAEGEIRHGKDLIDRIQWAACADMAIVLLSPESACKEWRRERWEPVFAEQASSLALLLLRDCRFPKLLRAGHFFDASRNLLAAQRALKRWILARCGRFESNVQLPKHDEPYSAAPDFLEQLRQSVADRPGIELDVPRNCALAFAIAFRDDFDAVLWTDCAYRDEAGILGDTGHLLNLKLAGSVKENKENLLDFCADRRFLFVFENMLPELRELFPLGERTSAIFTTRAKLKPPRPLAELATLFSNWTTNPASCLGALGEAKHHLELLPFLTAENAPIAMQLGSAMCALLKQCERFAEAYEILDLMKEAARTDGDTLRHYDFEWEQSWILERWETPAPQLERPHPAQPEPVQTGFDFGM
ncbi:MAG TPA: toll/interleukin-1 receptor domain-containing protein [Bryobacteraceae bacterium]|nr:toll/interleukin-1 receptor domain-containing protein [Bryobacteraceae bacterium]